MDGVTATALEYLNAKGEKLKGTMHAGDRKQGLEESDAEPAAHQ